MKLRDAAIFGAAAAFAGILTIPAVARAEYLFQPASACDQYRGTGGTMGPGSNGGAVVVLNPVEQGKGGDTTFLECPMPHSDTPRRHVAYSRLHR